MSKHPVPPAEPEPPELIEAREAHRRAVRDVESGLLGSVPRLIETSERLQALQNRR